MIIFSKKTPTYISDASVSVGEDEQLSLCGRLVDVTHKIFVAILCPILLWGSEVKIELHGEETRIQICEVEGYDLRSGRSTFRSITSEFFWAYEFVEHDDTF